MAPAGRTTACAQRRCRRNKYFAVEKFEKFSRMLPPGLAVAGLAICGCCTSFRSITADVATQQSVKQDSVQSATSVNIKVLLGLQQKEDSAFAQSVFAKAIIVIALTLAWIVHLLLPFDVRNSRPVLGVLDRQFLWVAALTTLAVFLVVLVPGVMFFHEVERDDVVEKKRR
jgi:hypothetical protein